MKKKQDPKQVIKQILKQYKTMYQIKDAITPSLLQKLSLVYSVIYRLVDDARNAVCRHVGLTKNCTMLNGILDTLDQNRLFFSKTEEQLQPFRDRIDKLNKKKEAVLQLFKQLLKRDFRAVGDLLAFEQVVKEMVLEFGAIQDMLESEGGPLEFLKHVEIPYSVDDLHYPPARNDFYRETKKMIEFLEVFAAILFQKMDELQAIYPFLDEFLENFTLVIRYLYEIQDMMEDYVKRIVKPKRKIEDLLIDFFFNQLRLMYVLVHVIKTKMRLEEEEALSSISYIGRRIEEMMPNFHRQKFQIMKLKEEQRKRQQERLKTRFWSSQRLETLPREKRRQYLGEIRKQVDEIIKEMELDDHRVKAVKTKVRRAPAQFGLEGAAGGGRRQTSVQSQQARRQSILQQTQQQQHVPVLPTPRFSHVDRDTNTNQVVRRLKQQNAQHLYSQITETGLIQQIWEKGRSYQNICIVDIMNLLEGQYRPIQDMEDIKLLIQQKYPNIASKHNYYVLVHQGNFNQHWISLFAEGPNFMILNVACLDGNQDCYLHHLPNPIDDLAIKVIETGLLSIKSDLVFKKDTKNQRLRKYHQQITRYLSYFSSLDQELRQHIESVKDRLQGLSTKTYPNILVLSKDLYRDFQLIH